jgi:hypothetical protein
MAVMSFASSRRIIQHLRVEPIARTRSWYTGGPVAFLERGVSCLGPNITFDKRTRFYPSRNRPPMLN